MKSPMKNHLLTCVLLGGQSDHKDVHLPNNTKALAILKGNGIIEDSTAEADVETNAMYSMPHYVRK